MTVRERVLADGDREVLPANDDTLERVARGEVLIVRQALAGTGLLTELRGLILAEVAAEAGSEVGQRLEADGLGALHRHLEGPAIEATLVRVTERLRGREAELVERLIQRLALAEDDCYVAEKSWVRFFVPQDCYAQNRARFARRVGHLRLQNPHRDSWFTNPSNAMVLWAAIGPVAYGNGMLIWPRLWGRAIAHRGFERNQHRIEEALHPGRPISFRLDPGDLLLFSGEHFHSSELNRTDQTRVVISFRLTRGAPRYGEGARFISYRALRHQRAGRPLLAALRCRLTLAYLRFLLQRRLAYEIGRRLPSLGRRPTTGADSLIPALRTEPPVEIALAPLEPGAIRPISEHHCVALTKAGPVLFARRCPHEGADLAAGYIEGSRLYCPWHHLRFDLPSGQQPCRSLANLRTWALTPLGDGCYRVGAAADGTAEPTR
jgi:nitrite reductase/ring-hydroxylating ferredoxin subunit